MMLLFSPKLQCSLILPSYSLVSRLKLNSFLPYLLTAIALSFQTLVLVGMHFPSSYISGGYPGLYVGGITCTVCNLLHAHVVREMRGI